MFDMRPNSLSRCGLLDEIGSLTTPDYIKYQPNSMYIPTFPSTICSKLNQITFFTTGSTKWTCFPGGVGENQY